MSDCVPYFCIAILSILISLSNFEIILVLEERFFIPTLSKTETNSASDFYGYDWRLSNFEVMAHLEEGDILEGNFRFQ